jgi:DNA primase
MNLKIFTRIFTEMNILEIIQADGFQFRKASSTRGGEYHGPCPFCGGNDRFRIQPAQDRCYCRQCGKSWDSIQYLRDFKGMDYYQALAHLGREPDFKKKPKPSILSPKKEPTPPPEAWQERAFSFAMQAQAILWDSAGSKMRRWLREEKGLNDETIRKAGLGYNPTDICEQREAWGLPPATNDEGKPKKQWLPAGLVIPFAMQGKVQRLRIRRSDPGDGNRYIIVSGSSMGPMILGNTQAKAAIVVESELDAILLWQEVGDLCDVIALGSAQAKPDVATETLLKRMETILVSLDDDVTGQQRIVRYWLKTFPKAKYYAVPIGKDHSEAWKAGLNIRLWVQAGLPDEKTGDTITPPEAGKPLVSNPDESKSFLQGETPPPETLEDTMADMVQSVCNSIISEHTAAGKQYHSTPEISAAESEIIKVHRLVLSGAASLEDYQIACDGWLEASRIPT